MTWHNENLAIPAVKARIHPASLGEDDPPMTMQVGMVGTDGIVIAGDTKWSNEPMLVNRNWAGGRYGFNSTKMKFSTEHGIAIACARDMTVSCWMAHQILTILKPEEYADPIPTITRIGT